MDKRLKFRIITAVTSIVAALVVLGLSTGLFSFWSNRNGYILTSGRFNGKVYYYTSHVSLKEGESKDTDLGKISCVSLKNSDNGVIAEFSFKSKTNFSNGVILSASPLFKATRDYSMKITAVKESCETALEFVSQSYDKNCVYCSYLLRGETVDDTSATVFRLTDIVINEYARK